MIFRNVQLGRKRTVHCVTLKMPLLCYELHATCPVSSARAATMTLGPADHRNEVSACAGVIGLLYLSGAHM
jgi:hypothetical protein